MEVIIFGLETYLQFFTLWIFILLLCMLWCDSMFSTQAHERCREWGGGGWVGGGGGGGGGRGGAEFIMLRKCKADRE